MNGTAPDILSATHVGFLDVMDPIMPVYRSNVNVQLSWLPAAIGAIPSASIVSKSEIHSLYTVGTAYPFSSNIPLL